LGSSSAEGEGDSAVEFYEEMVLRDQRFLCAIPKVKVQNETAEDASSADREKELARATDRGMELLREMEGRCIYYSAGWWSYSFCYMNQVRQFHAAVPGNGRPAYPPAEDPSTHSYILGRYHRADEKAKDESAPKKPTTEVVVRESRGDSRYLVQYLEDGTTCDLTGRERKIEVQFHCHPQSTDRIGWIKEVNTCSYLMVVYTPRLCNDVAFQPPRADRPHDIVCREIVSPEDADLWEIERENARDMQFESEHEMMPPEQETRGAIVGDIEVGAMKLVGKEGKRLEKGRVAFAGEEKVEIIARSVGGEYRQLSKEQLKKMKLDPKEIEAARKEIDQYARGKDWKLEVIDLNGERGLRGIIIEAGEAAGTQTGELGKEDQQKKLKKQEGEEEEGGSEAGNDETYKDEL
jgi:protein OS-9